MSGFAALMALSASQTKEAQSAVQTALEQRQRNEELKRKKREEIERKIREEEAKLRQKRLEDEKKEQELEAKREVERIRQEAEQTRREEEARNALLYGPKKARQHGPRWPTSHSGIKEEVRRRRLGEDDDDSRSGSPAVVLTREEKRQRRVEMEMRRMYQLKRTSSTGYTKAGRRLPGGAIDATSAPASDSGASAQSVKARLAALPNTLTRLNVNKRDTRTIDEILQDRAKAKHTTLDGDDAREFNDWFGKGKKKEPASIPGTQSSASLASTPSSGANSPRPVDSKAASQPPVRSQPLASNGKTAPNSSGTKSSSSQSRPALSTKTSSSTIPKLSSSAVKPSQPKSPVPKPNPTKSGFASNGAPPRPGGVPPKKRPRSPSFSLSPPPQKRRASEPESALSAEIWKLFGKDRNSYISRDVLSDDEDMEADASAVMKEELRSTRLAKREDELALEEEKRHEEEKRRRKRERERQGM